MRYLEAVKFIETGKYKDACWGSGEVENEKLSFNGYRVSFLQMKSILEMDGGSDCTMI